MRGDDAVDHACHATASEDALNADIDPEHDAILFPFLFADMDGTLQGESFAYSNSDLKCWDKGDAETEAATHDWGDAGRLIIYGHGSDAVDRRHHLYGAHNKIVTPMDLAHYIKTLNFPAGPDHEIIVWSCHSGGVGRFAQLLALHLINEGYTGKRVWGCNKYGGTIDRAQKCLKAADTTREVPHPATGADASFYIGVGNPLVRH
jgi:hypothetical protein